MNEILKIAQNVFEIEANEIGKLKDRITKDFELAVKAILESKGKLIVSGMGKSGLIGKKIAATLASTGTPSFFLHPCEAYHGDLGMIGKDDILLLISNSGETDEVLKIVPFLKSQGNTIISMTADSNSTLAKNSTYHLSIKVDIEACPLQLAPTSSTTATLVMGDALAVALMKLRNFKDMDFAKFHPGGSLGRKLLLKVEDVMKKENLPIVNSEDSTIKIVHIITKGKLGLCIVFNDSKIVGIITDGDVRRAMESKQKEFFSLKAKDLMITTPKIVNKNTKLIEANDIMTSNEIISLLVVDKKELIGIVQIYDLGV